LQEVADELEMSKETVMKILAQHEKVDSKANAPKLDGETKG
jgi:orotate phosphoribosyltransferase-like protein